MLAFYNKTCKKIKKEKKTENFSIQHISKEWRVISPKFGKQLTKVFKNEK